MNFRTVGKLISLRMLSSVVSLAYSALQVRIFGVNSEMDAFFIATTGLYVITSLTQSGQLAEVFLPEYIRLRKDSGPDTAFRLFSALINRMLVFSMLIFAILFFTAPWAMSILGTGLNPAYENTAIAIFKGSLSLIMFILISSFTNTLLNAEKIYGRVEINALLNGLISITLLLTLHDKLGVWVLLISLLCGKITEFIIGFFLLYRIGYRYRLCWNTPGFNLNNLFRVMIPTSGYVASTQFYTFVLTHYASFLPEGSFSLFKYVQQISMKATAMVISPLSSVFFSEFAHRIHEGSQKLTEFMKKPLVFILTTTLSALIACYWMGLDILHILWSKKSLTSSDYAYCEILLLIFFSSFTIQNASQLFRNATVALGSAKRLYNGWIIGQLLSALCCAVLIPWLGITGLGLIPFVNSAFQAIVIAEGAHKNGIHVREAFRLKNYIHFLFFVVLLFLTLFLLKPFISQISDGQKLIWKVAIFALAAGSLALIFLKKELLNLATPSGRRTRK